MPLSKLYVITRRDLGWGAQAVQGMHAATELGVQHPELVKKWHAESNTVVFISVADEPALKQLQRCLIEATPFYEPDFGGALTALAMIDPPKRYVQRLPLALTDIRAPGGIRTPDLAR